MATRKAGPVSLDPGQLPLIPDDELPVAAEADLARMAHSKGPISRQVLVLTYPTADGGTAHSAFSRLDDAIAAQADFPQDTADLLAVNYYLTVGDWRVMRD